MTAATQELIRESATVVLLRDSDAGLEVLMLQKNSKLNYGGSWVFPGGLAEDEDSIGLEHLNDEQLRISISKNIVVRETREETGLEIEHELLAPFANWLTPNFRIKRYNTLFFLAQLSDHQATQPIQIDQEEIVDHKWLNPATALAQQADSSLLLNGPSFVTLKHLEACTDSAAAIAALSSKEIYYYEPRGLKTATGVATVYRGDCAYELDELNHQSIDSASGPKHRLYMHKNLPWEFHDTRVDKVAR